MASLLAVPLVQGVATKILVDGVYYSKQNKSYLYQISDGSPEIGDGVTNLTSDVNSSTLASAGALINGNFQLTDSTITNLTKIGLPDATLFDFDTTNGRLANRSSSCKAYPGDSAWPSTSVWDIFDLLTGGALIATVPLAAPCYADWPANQNSDKCLYITDDWSNSSLQ